MVSISNGGGPNTLSSGGLPVLYSSDAKNLHSAPAAQRLAHTQPSARATHITLMYSGSRLQPSSWYYMSLLNHPLSKQPLSLHHGQLQMQPRLAPSNLNMSWKKEISLLYNRSELHPKVMAVEPFFPQHISAAINIVPAHIKKEAFCRLCMHVFHTTQYETTSPLLYN